MVPDPLTPKLAPVPTTMAALVLVLVVMPEKARDEVEAAVIVIAGQVPERVMLVPAIKAGVAVPLPPFATATMPVI